MSGEVGTGRYPGDGVDVSGVTADGAAWLASAGTYPRSTLTLWEERPAAPVVLPCGTVFDVVSVPAIFGRRMLDRLWDGGPGSGPVAVYRGRMLLFASPGTAQRLPTLLEWEEWGSPGRTGAVPPLLCHGAGDAVTVPAVLRPDPSDRTDPADRPGGPGRPGVTRLGSRWLVAPDTLRPWLPGPEVLLWAAVRAARSSASATVRVSIFPPADQGAKVYDVSRRR
ncbi:MULTISPECIES: bifunctional DNA primase/polymerase [Streptomyces]|uniref:Bifunctional DNA primase/polymerase n=1 Tax=Streptomyces griseiscabiei TaxID=2993540 RepID=A0ABU4L0K5_9ACTN|nr:MULTISPECIES: bifunctional DNA primase/polymerase [Streptomyces]MBZ3900989.1 bifunctional DNA primase/polymerase [Streptomyces griseiscabiei]MDX2908880.1 bifunctional DNA primase/polymerase [Streptomyces griseiscabiei]